MLTRSGFIEEEEVGEYIQVHLKGVTTKDNAHIPYGPFPLDFS